jgi:hypothetical protein
MIRSVTFGRAQCYMCEEIKEHTTLLTLETQPCNVVTVLCYQCFEQLALTARPLRVYDAPPRMGVFTQEWHAIPDIFRPQ